MVAALLARRVSFPWGDGRVYPNLFVILAGKSGDRKSSAITLVERLAKAVLANNRFLPETCGAETLVDEYDETLGGSPDKLLIADDANPILGTWEKTAYGERVGQRFLTLYDCKPLVEAFRRNKKGDDEGRSRRLAEQQRQVGVGRERRIAKARVAITGQSRRSAWRDGSDFRAAYFCGVSGVPPYSSIARSQKA